MNTTEAVNIYIVGIKGSAMSNIAVILKQMGKRVTGCDTGEEFVTDPILAENGISWDKGFMPEALTGDTDLVLYSAAHGGERNPIVESARARGIRAENQATFLKTLMEGFKTRIAVSGCHGKTTTSSLMAYALNNLGVEPGYLIGTPYFNGLPGGRYGGKKDFFVIEADEYGVNPPQDKTPKLLLLDPTHSICTNIDYDHPDVYENLESTKKTFLNFFKKGKLYLCADDNNLRSLFPMIGRGFLTYGYSTDANMVISNLKVSSTGSSFSLSLNGSGLGEFNIALYGEKNVLNSAGVILALMDMGFEPRKAAEAVKGFASVKRRFEQIFEKDGTYLYDDYGHHPAEISSTIAAARSRFKNNRLVFIFQPHTYSRTFALKTDFARSLSQSDLALIAPIFPSARENSSAFPVTSHDIEKEAVVLGKDNVLAYTAKSDLLAKLPKTLKKGDVIFTVGAGDIYKLKDDIIQIISLL